MTWELRDNHTQVCLSYGVVYGCRPGWRPAGWPGYGRPHSVVWQASTASAQGAEHRSSSRGHLPSSGFRSPPSLPLPSRTSARQGAVPSLLSRELLGPRLPVPSCPDVAAAPQLSAAGGSAQRGAARLRHGLRQRHRGVLRRSRRRSPGGRLPRAVSPVRPPPCLTLPCPALPLLGSGGGGRPAVCTQRVLGQRGGSVGGEGRAETERLWGDGAAGGAGIAVIMLW